jgi:hypothetical protein
MQWTGAKSLKSLDLSIKKNVLLSFEIVSTTLCHLTDLDVESLIIFAKKEL